MTTWDHTADGVFQGGGVKGLALVGAILEFADKTLYPDDYVEGWKNLAGTSAGAIIAAYLACGHDATETRTLVEDAPYARFADWGWGGPYLRGGPNLLFHRGLTRGKFFHDWFNEKIDGWTFDDIKRNGRTLKIIAADITHRELLELPDDLSKYRDADTGRLIDPDRYPVAKAVRMSMSIPYFFPPVTLVRDDTGQPAMIVDGGLLSNFPVWLFDVEERNSARPTFGFRLVDKEKVRGGLGRVVRGLGWSTRMAAGIFRTATDAWDRRFLSRATEVRTCAVEARGIGTTQFNVTEAQQQELLDSGHDAARTFLAAWRPEDYVNSHGRRLNFATGDRHLAVTAAGASG